MSEQIKHSVRYTEDFVLSLLKKHRYNEDAYAVLPQVANKTGSGVSRTADAVVMGLWPSRGLTLEGIEIKVSRSDWLRELSNPSKADVIFRYCDKWYVACPVGVVDLKKDAFPETWGLLEIEQTRDQLLEKHEDSGYRVVQEPWFRVVERVKAPVRKDVEEPGRGFLASLLRNLQLYSPGEEEVRRQVAEAKALVLRESEEVCERQLSRVRAEQLELKKQVLEFERATGLSVFGDSWGQEKRLEGIGRRLRLLEQMETESSLLESSLEIVASRARSVLSAIEAMKAG